MRHKLYAELLRDCTQPELAGKFPDSVHINKLRIRKTESKRRQMKTLALKIQIFHVVHGRMPNDERIRVL